MIRPLTCVCLVLAAGSGLYLYQVKQRAFALDASLRSTFHDIDAARDRSRMLRADWALVNDPERLQALASQYLKLQPMQPSQLLTMDRLAAALPPPGPFPAPAAPAPSAPVPSAPAPWTIGKPAPVVDPTHGLPMAAATPQVLPSTVPATPQVALLEPAPLQPTAPLPTAPQSAAPQPAAPQPAASQAVAPQPAAPEPAASQAGAMSPASPSLPQSPDLAMTAPVPHGPSKPPHRGTHHPAPQAEPWLAQTNGSQTPARHHGAHHAAPPPRQFYAANVPPSGADAAPRITPEAATVMYRPTSGSSLGMASSAELAPPRPLYSTSQ